MAGSNPDLVIRVAANIAALQADVSQAVATLKAIEGATKDGTKASEGFAGALDQLGSGWVSRIAEGMLLRDAIREIIAVAKDLIVYLPEIAMQGAKFEDISESFAHLTSEAGLLGSTLIGTLRTATHGTVDDLVLMQRVNKDLAAGLTLTDAQFGLTSQAAYALAKATGTSTVEALDKMSDAMVTGRTKGIALLTGKLDLKQAEDSYATSMGKTVEEMTPALKLEVDRAAILKAIEAGLGRVGAQTDNLDDKVAQAQVAWANFQLELGKAIAQSPVVAAGMDSIRDSLIQAFGGKQEEAVKQISAVVNELAIHVIDFGIGATQAATVVYAAWSGLQVVILAVEMVVMGVVDAIGEVLLVAAKLGGKLGLVSPEDIAMGQAFVGVTRTMTEGLKAETAEAAAGVLGHSEFNKVIDKTAGALFVARDAMVSATGAVKGHTEATAAFVGPQQQVNEGWQESKATIKLAAAALLELTKLQDEYANVAIKRSGTVTQREIADINLHFQTLWASLEKAGTLTAEVADQIDKNWAQALNGVGKSWGELEKYSRQALDDTAARAKATYEEALLHSNNFSRGAIQHFRDLADSAAEQATAWGNPWDAALEDMANKADKAAAALGRVKAAADAAKPPAVADAIHLGAFDQVDYGTVEGQAEANSGKEGTLSDYLRYYGVFAGPEMYALHMKAVADGKKKLHDLGVPGFAGGTDGFQDFGAGTLAMLHGREAVVPEGSAAAGGLGGGDIHIYITQPLGTPTAIAAAVDAALMQRQRNIGTRFSRRA